MISSNGHYKYARISNGKWMDLIKWRKSKLVKKGSTKNKLAIKKTGSKYVFYVNAKRLDSSSATPSTPSC